MRAKDKKSAFHSTLSFRIRPAGNGNMPRNPAARWLRLLVVMILLVGALAAFTGRMRRVEQSLLETGAVGWATGLLSESAAAGMEAVTGSLTQMGTDGEGNVTFLSVDPVQLNLLSSAAVSYAQQKMSEGGYEAAVPLGSILSSEFFSGVGPMVTFRFYPVGGVRVSCRSSTESAGVNQTAYRVVLSMEMEVAAVTTFSSHTVTVPYELIAAETLVAGDVPAVYAYASSSSVPEN